MSDSELLMKFERAKAELEMHIDTTDGMRIMHDIHRMSDEPSNYDLLEDMEKLTEIVSYLLNWRLHSVKKAIRFIHEQREEEDDGENV